MKCADSVRVAHPLFQAERGGSTPTSALDLYFAPVRRDQFKSLNKLWHSRLPKIGGSHGRVYYGATHDDIYYAVAMWSNPVARLLPQRTWLELRRLAISNDAPKNTASRMLGWMVRDIRKRFPEVERCISYQDTEAHTGTIYRAAGWWENDLIARRPRSWNRWRSNRTDQSVCARIRWELSLKES